MRAAAIVHAKQSRYKLAPDAEEARARDAAPTGPDAATGTGPPVTFAMASIAGLRCAESMLPAAWLSSVVLKLCTETDDGWLEVGWVRLILDG